MRSLIAATKSSDIRKILEEIGDHQNVELDVPFGDFKFCWHPFGNKMSNASSIGLGKKPGRSLTERITNATDAVLEDRAPQGVAPPNSARAAAQQWFGRPISGPGDGLFNKWDYAAHNYDRKFAVVMSECGSKSTATIDVIDDGIGISPEQFPTTILSLQEGNKINKWYLIGAFGQGGAATLSFADYAVIVSRHRENPRVVGFTVIRVLNLSDHYKEDCYGYLCLLGPSGSVSVPSCQIDEEALELYPQFTGPKVPVLRKGTLVRHISYQLPKLDASLQASPGNLYHYLHCSAFDPLLPFRLIDLRNNEFNDQIVTGSRNRLMRVDEFDPENISTGTFIRYERPMEYFVPHGTTDACIGIEFWVVFNYRSGKGKNKGDVTLRTHSNELYVQTNYPIVGTLNGQNQGELSAQILRDLHLGQVARHIVIHIDASRAESRIRRQLFSSDREGLKDGQVLTSLVQMLEKMLGEDETLHEIERELTEKLARRESQTTSEAVKRQIVQLLQEAGLKVQSEGPMNVPGAGDDKQPVKKSRKGKPTKAAPLPTLPFPQVTRWVIVHPKPYLRVHINDNESVLVHTDADSEFERQGRLSIRSEPDCLELAGQSKLTGGRVKWRLRPRHTAKIGDVGRVVVTITKPDGTQLTDEVNFEVLAPLEERTKKSKGFVPQFDVIAINPIDDPEQWAAAWPHLSEDVTDEEQSGVAYKPISAGGGIVVYYSTVFGPFKDQLEKLKVEAAALPSLFRTNYEIWIGYHAILQENARGDMKAEIDDEQLENILEEDRTRVAKMQVKQARSTADLMNKSMAKGTE
ncbi:hypothetical protein [Singulisphaera sp. PoT]|uniref:hypothetical protein n=1 Tax=Singulisphaera sp. PoT TaxID=3411797 RepID=UPI003BF5BF96